MKKIKILIITGLQAKEIIIKNLEKYEKHDLYLKVLPMPIAAFITPKLIIYHLKENKTLTSLNTDNTTPINNIDIVYHELIRLQECLSIILFRL